MLVIGRVLVGGERDLWTACNPIDRYNRKRYATGNAVNDRLDLKLTPIPSKEGL
jgi:hypothetical protein